MDFAQRAFHHNNPFDPVVRSLLDTDFYKLLMLQFIWKRHYHTQVSFALTNRTQVVKLVDCIEIQELRAQLDHVRSLRFRASELIWLRGQTFYGHHGLFEEGFLDFLRTLALPEYVLEPEVIDGEPTGQWRLEFHGPWVQTTLWEIHALEIVNELRYRRLMRAMSPSRLDILYARAKTKLHDKLTVLSGVEGLSLTDFGTRRRHSFLWQEHCVLTAREMLGDQFTGTSNAYLAMKHDLDAKGTHAHELPMVLAALADTDAGLLQSQYEVLRQWQQVYRGGLLVMLPDTFGSTQFLAGLDPITAMTWTGARPDSKDPIVGGEELLAFWERTDPAHARDKLIIFSDGLDVHLPGHPPRGQDMVRIQEHFRGRVRLGFGFGTNLTNDFVEGSTADNAMKPVSLVCKVLSANGRPACKLSDNASKSTGPAETIARYRRVFGSAGIRNHPVTV